MSSLSYLLVFAGSGLGGMLRFWLGRSVFPMSHFPFGTLLVNVLACFLAGFLISRPELSQPVHTSWKLFLITGFCGGFSTFSAFGIDFLSLSQKGFFSMGFVYVAASLIFCLSAAILGSRMP
jgi:CrcB protein